MNINIIIVILLLLLIIVSMILVVKICSRKKKKHNVFRDINTLPAIIANTLENIKLGNISTEKAYFILLTEIYVRKKLTNTDLYGRLLRRFRKIEKIAVRKALKSYKSNYHLFCKDRNDSFFNLYQDIKYNIIKEHNK